MHYAHFFTWAVLKIEFLRCIGIDVKELSVLLSNLKGHLYTISKHRHEVMKNCFKSGIILQGLMHDLSKYSPTEFVVGVSHYQGNRSPNEGEREDYGYSKAWMHHKGRNKHHFEYWTDYNPETKKLTPVIMPKRYVVEMFCDRVAASKVYKGNEYNDKCPLEYYVNGKTRRNIHPKTADEIERLLTMLADKGEEKTFEYIRKAIFLGKNL